MKSMVTPRVKKLFGFAARKSGIFWLMPLLLGSAMTTKSNAQTCAISGPATVCKGSTITLASASAAAGTWSSSNIARATVNSSGVVTGVASGSVNITYTSGACYSVKNIVVNTSPTATVYASSMCAGAVLSCSSSGNIASGAWQNGSSTISAITGGSLSASPVSINGNSPFGMFVAVNGDMYVADANNSRILKYTFPFTGSSAPVVVAGGNGYGSGANQLAFPNNVYVSAAGDIYVADYGNSRIQKFPAGSTSSTSGTTVAQSGLSGASYVTLDASGNMYVADNSNHRVVMFPPGSDATTAGTVVASGFSYVQSLWLTPAGDLYVADYDGNRILKYTGATGTGIVVAGGNGAGSAANQFYYTTGVAVDNAGNVYVVDKGNNRVQKFPAGSTSATNGITVATGLNTPQGIFADNNGVIYIADYANDRVQVYYNATSGSYTTTEPGTYKITLTNASGCSATSNIVTINSMPAAIAGAAPVCAGATIALTETASGGTWSSSTSKATVSSTGVVTGVASGTATISYSLGFCRATTVITVNANPSSITGTSSVCTGLTTTLSSSTAGGSWSANNDNASVSVGVVTGAAVGTTVVSYTLGSGCYKTAIVTVNASPAAITGAGSICIGSTLALGETTEGGTWSSSTSKATVSSIGIVTGVSSGTATISYSLGSCRATSVFTVNANPSSITGTASVCTGLATTLSSSTTGGSWSTSNDNASVSAGVVTGAAAGTTIVSYTLPTGCYKATVVTVNASPEAITGAGTMCKGTTATLASTTTGGTWSSSATSVATVGSAGIVTGVAAGTATISYNLGSCRKTAVMTILATPSVTVAATSACAGASLTFTATGSITSAAWKNAGSTISAATPILNETPVSIYGSNPFGVFVAPNKDMYVADADGNRILKYTYPFTSSSTPVVVAGGMGSGSAANQLAWPTSVYMDGAGNLYVSDFYNNRIQKFPAGSVGGTAATTVAAVGLNNPSYAAIDGSGNLYVSNNSAGNVMKYAAGSDATTTGTVITSGLAYVQSLFIAPSGDVYIGDYDNARVLKYPAGGGALTVVAGGNGVGSAANQFHYVTGVALDAEGALYVVDKGNGRVQKFPAGSTGTTDGTTVAADLYTPQDLFVDAAGSIYVADYGNSSMQIYYNAVPNTYTTSAPGTYNVTVTGDNGCAKTSNTVTLNTTPAAITGTAVVCQSATTALNTTTTGGTWSSSSSSTASIGTGGIVTGGTAGTATISYNLGSCRATRVVTVNASPAAISGTASVCAGAATTLSSTTSGGTWTINNPAIATINAGTHVVTGVSTGTTMVSYTVSTGCFRTRVVTVNPLPDAGTLTGASTVAVGASVTFTDAAIGGVLSSSNPSIASINPSTGVVTGMATGTATIVYTATNSCGTATSTATIIVTPGLGKPDNSGANVNTNQSVVVFPNPATDNLNVQSSVAGTFILYAVDAKVIGNYPVAEGITPIRLPYDLAAGSYIGRFVGQDGTEMSFRIVIR